MDSSKTQISIKVASDDAYNDCDLSFKQCNLLIGRNGSGKSAFLKKLHDLFIDGASPGGSISANEMVFAGGVPFDDITTFHISESRYNPSKKIPDKNLNSVKYAMPFSKDSPPDKTGISDDLPGRYDEILSSIFDRKLCAAITPSGTYMVYDKTGGLVTPDQDGYGIHHAHPIIQTILSAKNSVILIEEIEEYLHPTAIEKLLHYIFKFCRKNNNTVFITSHSIITLLEFVKNQSNYVDSYTITKFTERDGTMGLVQLSEHNFDGFLDGFMGNVLNKTEVDILRRLSASK